MEKKEFYKYDVIPLNEKDSKTINGGWITTAIAIASAIIYIYNNGDDFIEGFKEGYNETN